VEQIPNFLSLPLQQQLKSMQHAQVRVTIFMSDPTLAYRNLICRILCNRDGLLSNNNNNRGRLQRNSNTAPSIAAAAHQQQQQRPNHTATSTTFNNRKHNPQQTQQPNLVNPALAGSHGHTPSQLHMTASSQANLNDKRN